MNIITTINDYLQFEATKKDVYINSKRSGKVLVPCMNTLLVNPILVEANTYNPNSVSPDKMNLLRQSILDNGFCFAIVCIYDEEKEMFVIVDGFHRSLIGGKEWLDFDYIPIVVLKHSATQRMAATIQFNKARGVHQVDLDADVIRALLEQGLTEEEVSTKLGIDLETIHRYKSLTGIADLFKNAQHSTSWSMEEVNNEE